MTTAQREALQNNVATFGYCKTAELIRKFYNEGLLNYHQTRAIFSTLRIRQLREVGTISANLWSI